MRQSCRVFNPGVGEIFVKRTATHSEQVRPHLTVVDECQPRESVEELADDLVGVALGIARPAPTQESFQLRDTGSHELRDSVVVVACRLPSHVDQAIIEC